jgi:hypothetical protein
MFHYQRETNVDLISKKELLASTGISYGQLYRWKREGLLPEEWFIKQSSFTGQETFFPRDQIVSRVKAILELKDDHSLEELSRLLMSDSEATVSFERLKGLTGIDPDFPSVLRETAGTENLTVAVTALAYAIHRKAKEKGIPKDTEFALIRSAVPAMQGHPAHDTLCTIIAAAGDHHVCLTTGPARPTFDDGIATIASVSIGEAMNELRMIMEGI